MNLKEIWHLVSKSMTYDEAAELWASLVHNQEKAENTAYYHKLYAQSQEENKQLKQQLKTSHAMMLAAKERGDELAGIVEKQGRKINQLRRQLNFTKEGD